MIESTAYLTKEEELAVLRRRSAFSTPEGIKTLAEIVISARVFEKIDIEDKEGNAVRNFAIDLLDSMCMVQDGRLEALLANMLSTPLPEFEQSEDEEKAGTFQIFI